MSTMGASLWGNSSGNSTKNKQEKSPKKPKQETVDPSTTANKVLDDSGNFGEVLDKNKSPKKLRKEKAEQHAPTRIIDDAGNFGKVLDKNQPSEKPIKDKAPDPSIANKVLDDAGNFGKVLDKNKRNLEKNKESLDIKEVKYQRAPERNEVLYWDDVTLDTSEAAAGVASSSAAAFGICDVAAEAMDPWGFYSGCGRFPEDEGGEAAVVGPVRGPFPEGNGQAEDKSEDDNSNLPMLNPAGGAVSKLRKWKGNDEGVSGWRAEIGGVTEEAPPAGNKKKFTHRRKKQLQEGNGPEGDSKKAISPGKSVVCPITAEEFPTVEEGEVGAQSWKNYVQDMADGNVEKSGETSATANEQGE
jgi:hypothetical protein